MKNNFSKTVRLVLFIIIVLAVYALSRIRGELTAKSPAGIYVSSINSTDTLWLYTNGEFKQVVYNKDTLVYSCTSKWRKTTMGIRIDSILLYDDLNYLKYWKEYPLEGGQYTGLRLEQKTNRYVLSWRDYVDIPEKSINYIMIKEFK